MTTYQHPKDHVYVFISFPSELISVFFYIDIKEILHYQELNYIIK